MISAASPGPTVTTVSKEGRRKLRSVKGRSILETLRENGIYISALCSGRGTCGKCRIQVAEGEITVSEEDRRFFTPEEQEERERSFRQNMTRQWTSGQQLWQCSSSIR